ncbi:MAG: DegT/DnrJ/EryC1/StrS family aminotransferase [Phycisphaerae bacterium]|nr:DegT/DnrJ/EryC1/StrS family aminotransferase [Phycisphaerae bacterium]
MVDQLAVKGGPKAVTTDPGDIFTWPIVTTEDEQAVLEVLRTGRMSAWDVTLEFEKEHAEWHGVEHALAFNTGTGSLQAAFWACGLGCQDELIGPSMTYWASCLPALTLGATIVFAETDPETLCIDPGDIEHRITDRTKVIVAVHYAGHPCDMDPIMEIAAKHGIKVVEDVSHAHGGLYRGRLVGTIGHAGAMSIMSGKALAAGEGGVLITNDTEIWRKATAWGHYERTAEVLKGTEWERFAGLPMGACKNRMHQCSSAMGRVQLRHYKARMEEIQKAMNYFWDQLEGVPGIRAHRPPKDSGSTMGGWYAARGIYRAEEIGGLPIEKFVEAVRAEGVGTGAGANLLMHKHPLLNELDIYGDGKPTRLAQATRDVLQPAGSLPRTEKIPTGCFTIPWFKHYRPEIIDEHALAFRKVCTRAEELL